MIPLSITWTMVLSIYLRAKHGYQQARLMQAVFGARREQLPRRELLSKLEEQILNSGTIDHLYGRARLWQAGTVNEMIGHLCQEFKRTKLTAKENDLLAYSLNMARYEDELPNGTEQMFHKTFQHWKQAYTT
jgi:hypothetical protein